MNFRYNDIIEDLTTRKWIKGHLGRFWDKPDYTNLPYIKQDVTPEEVDDWVNKGYDYVKSYTGSMYDNRNEMPTWIETFKGIFPSFKNMTFTIYKMETLEIMPCHVDHFRTYMRLFNVPYTDCYRILVMLDDWKPGHYLEIDGHGITNWIAGDYFIWKSDVPHAASNIGTVPRYTLQISCTPVKKDEAWTTLHWYNIPDLHTKFESAQWHMTRVLDCINEEQKQKPFYIYMYNSTIKGLDDITHDDATIDHLNKTGIVFYLTEPLCSYLEHAPILFPPKGTKHDMVFYSEFKGKEYPRQFRSDELDTIERYVKRNSLVNVTVYTCDYDAEKWYPYYKYLFQVKTDDLFVKSLIPKTIRSTEVLPTFNKKFICLNWRYTSHRHLVAAYLAPMSSYVSWHFRGELSIIGRGKWFDIFDWRDKDPNIFFKILGGMEYLNRNAPMNVDFEVNTPVTITDKYFMRYMPEGTITEFTEGNYENGKIEEVYRDIFVDIVNESRYAQPTGNYSEKVFHPIWYKKPFVLVAPPHTLKYMREQGFKTFSEFWDESYDDITNHEDRLFAIFNLINYIDSKSIDELRELYKQMKDVLDHNYNLLKSMLKPKGK